MTAVKQIVQTPTLRIVDSTNECFDTYEDYVKHCNQVRKYLRTLPSDKWIKFESIPVQYHADAVRIVMEQNFAIVCDKGAEFMIFFKNQI
jgi:hypothetical protein